MIILGEHGTVETSVLVVSTVLLLYLRVVGEKETFMTKRKRENTSDNLDRRVKEGRGIGRRGLWCQMFRPRDWPVVLRENPLRFLSAG